MQRWSASHSAAPMSITTTLSGSLRNVLPAARLDVRPWESATTCFTQARAQGRVVAAAALTADAVPLETLNVQQPLLLVFGNEVHGLSQEVCANEARRLGEREGVPRKANGRRSGARGRAGKAE